MKNHFQLHIGKVSFCHLVTRCLILAHAQVFSKKYHQWKSTSKEKVADTTTHGSEPKIDEPTTKPKGETIKIHHQHRDIRRWKVPKRVLKRSSHLCVVGWGAKRGKFIIWIKCCFSTRHFIHVRGKWSHCETELFRSVLVK